MRIDVKNINPALVEMINNPEQIIFLDANIFIPPDRSALAKHINAFRFEDYKNAFLEPLLQEFPRLAVHETVYQEIVAETVKTYVWDMSRIICCMEKSDMDRIQNQPN